MTNAVFITIPVVSVIENYGTPETTGRTEVSEPKMTVINISLIESMSVLESNVYKPISIYYATAARNSSYVSGKEVIGSYVKLVNGSVFRTKIALDTLTKIVTDALNGSSIGEAIVEESNTGRKVVRANYDDPFHKFRKGDRLLIKGVGRHSTEFRVENLTQDTSNEEFYMCNVEFVESDCVEQILRREGL